MSPPVCLSCRRPNPSEAAYCYFDGTPLSTMAQGPRAIGSEQLLTPFVFPSGQTCRSFEELAHACRTSWEEAQQLFQSDLFRPFLMTIGRADLVVAAEQAAQHPDPDLGLDEFLARLPGPQPAPARLEVSQTEIDLGTLVLGQDRSVPLTFENRGQRLLAGTVRTTRCLWLGVGTPQLNEKRFAASADEQVQLTLYLRGKHLRAAARPQTGEVVIESNGGVRSVYLRIHVPVTPFSDTVLQGAHSPRELARKGKAAPHELARVLEDGSVARWYASNGWTYPITGPAARGLAAVQQYFEALGLTTAPPVELRTTVVTLHGSAGGSALGRVLLATSEKRPVYAHAQADQPWLSVAPTECRGPEAVIPLSVPRIPSCPGQTLAARLAVHANGDQHFEVSVNLHVGPPAADGVEPWDPGTPPPLPPLPPPGLPPLPALPPLPPLPEPSWQEADREPLLLPDQQGSSAGARPWLGLVVAGLLLVSVLVFAGAVALAVGIVYWREASSPTSLAQDPSRPLPEPAPARPAEPAPTRPEPEPAPKPNPLRPGRDSLALQELLDDLKDPDRESNEKALRALRDLEDALARQAIPAVLAAARRHTDNDFRQLAARELQRLGAPLRKDVACLEVALQIPHRSIQRYAVSALREMGDRARESMDIVALALRHSSPEVRSEALAILKGLGPDARVQAIRLLFAPASEADEDTSRGVLHALLDESPPTAVETDVLIEVLRDVKARTSLRCFALDRLAAARQADRLVPVLLDVLREKPEARLLTRAIRALGRLGERRPEVLPPLLALAGSDAEEAIRLDALQVVSQLDPLALSTRELLERWTAEKSSRIRPLLSRMLEARLARLEPEQITELRPYLRHKEPAMVQVALAVVQARKAAAADVALEVSELLRHDDVEVRASAVQALDALGPAIGKTLPRPYRLLLDHWIAEKNPAVRDALGKLLRDQLALIGPDQMRELLPFLRHRDPAIVRLGLQVAQARKAEAAELAGEVAGLLKHDETEVRAAAVQALNALGPAGTRELPYLSRLLLEQWAAERDPGVREAIGKLLETRLARLKTEQMKELLPFLRHKETDIVQMALKVIQERREKAAEVAPEVAALVRSETPELRQAALEALKAMGMGAARGLPALFEVLDETPRDQRTPLVLTVAGMVDPKSSDSTARVISFLLAGLHPEALQGKGADTEAAINQALLRIGQPAVEGIFKVLDPASRGKDEINYRKNLYNALAALGPTCRSQASYSRLRALRDQEIKKKYPDVIEAAGKALNAMYPP